MICASKEHSNKGNQMLDKLKELFKEGLGYTHVAGILQQVANIVNIVNVQYVKDVDAKNLAIDIICDLLKSHKDPIITPEAKNAST
jgi:hypothetical protein